MLSQLNTVTILGLVQFLSQRSCCMEHLTTSCAQVISSSTFRILCTMKMLCSVFLHYCMCACFCWFAGLHWKSVSHRGESRLKYYNYDCNNSIVLNCNSYVTEAKSRLRHTVCLAAKEAITPHKKQYFYNYDALRPLDLQVGDFDLLSCQQGKSL